MIKVKKSPGKRGIQWKLQLGSLYDVSLVGGNFIFIPQLRLVFLETKKWPPVWRPEKRGMFKKGKQRARVYPFQADTGIGPYHRFP